MSRDYDAIAEKHAQRSGWTLEPMTGCYSGQQYRVRDKIVVRGSKGSVQRYRAVQRPGNQIAAPD